MAGIGDDVDQADVIALLAAHVRGDEVACQELLSTMEMAAAVRCMSLAIGLAIEVACRELPGGRGEFGRMLQAWQVRRRGSLS